MEKPKKCSLCSCRDITFIQTRGWDDLYLCASCKVVFAWPQIKKVDLESYYDEVTDPEYLVKYEQESLKRAQRILAFIHKKNIYEKILDLGCGCGFFLKESQKQGSDAEGVELSKKAIELASKNGDFKIYQGEVLEVLSKLPTYKVIAAQHILEHMHQPLDFFKLIWKKLEPQGILVLAIPNYNSWMRQWAEMHWVLLREQGHLFHFNIESLQKWLKQSRFQILDYQTPQWNSLDLLWAWRQRGKEFKELKVNSAQSKKRVQSERKKELFFRQMVSIGGRPLALLAEKMKKGGELLVFAQKI